MAMSRYEYDARATGERTRCVQARPIVIVLVSLCALSAFFLASCASFASARTVPLIERVWEFDGGEVSIEEQPAGTFVGTVVKATTFAECPHEVSEKLWTAITPQPDGSYWGLDQWFGSVTGGPDCVRIERGPTAWRVLEAPTGGHYLDVCFSKPGTSQPTIALDGTVANDTFGCVPSAEIAPVASAATESFSQSVSLPGAKECYSHRSFKIHLTDPPHDPIKDVVVTIHGRRVAVLHRGKVFVATIDLKGLPRGTFTVKIDVTTVLGHHLTGSRTYHTCVPKAARPKGKRHGHTQSRG